MSEKEYIVTLKEGVDYDAFNQEMIAETGSGDIPGRTVSVADARLGSQRNTHYMLTTEEVESLKNDIRVFDVDLPPDQNPDIEIGIQAVQIADFDKSTSDSGNYRDWGKIRHSFFEQQYASNSTNTNRTFSMDGLGVDVVIQDSGLQVDHPEFFMDDTADYVSGDIISDNTNSEIFPQSMTVHGLKIVQAGAIGGQSAVPDNFTRKVGQVIKLLIDPTGTHINLTNQKRLIATLKGDTGTFHAGFPTAQRIGNSAGSSYDPNWLLDPYINSYTGYQAFLNAHMTNDMIWYQNASGPQPTTSDSEIEEVMEHLFHTIHLFGLPGATPNSATALNWRATSYGNDTWKTTELHLAMKEAIDAGKFDPSGYASSWATNTTYAEIAYKEYMYLLNWGMWSMSEFWSTGSLSPEWTDDMRTPEGIRKNNPQGYQLFKKYFMPVLSKPSFTTLKSMFKGNDQGNLEYVAQNGANRVHLINWADESGLSFTQDVNHYRDYDGHGTHCGGTAVGKNFGWGTKARVFSVKVAGLEGSGDSGNGISISNVYDCIKQWHNNKEADPFTGLKRPTIVNASWGYSSSVGSSINNITSIVYRGTTYSSGNDGSFGNSTHMRDTYGYYPYYSNGSYRYPVRVASVDTDVEECISAGVHICIAAGNNSFKADLSTGDDYGNIVFSTSSNNYYHRGSSPFSDNAFMVGCMDSTPEDESGNVEKKTGFSTTGPAVNIFAAGEYIVSACSTTNRFGAPSYFDGGGFKQTNISGTSMASPQVCGVGALYLQASPELTPAQLQNKINNNAKALLKDENNLTNYGDTTDICGAENRMLFNKYNKQTPFSISLDGSSSTRFFGLQKR